MNWLNALSPESIAQQAFPLQEVLHNSFYYPSSWFDGGVIKDCNTLAKDLQINSFIYCDYAVGKAAFLQKQPTFVGYKVLASRNVTAKELIPNGWQNILPPGVNRNDYQYYKNEWEQFVKELENKRVNGELKKGRPVNENSERQKRIKELESKRELGLVKRGRPKTVKIVTDEVAA